MIYFDNAATGGYKPYSVTEGVVDTIRYLSANPTRSGHRMALSAAKLVYTARREIADYFGNGSPERVVFTKNCTEAMNTALFGAIKKGSRVITTVFEHNAVLRPLYKLERDGIITLKIISPTGGNGLVENMIEEAKNADAAVMTGASNVTGEVFDVGAVGREMRKTGGLFIVDAAQAAGHVRLDMEKNCIDILCASGHKGMYGIMGSGLLVFNENVEISPLTYGGTGIETFEKDMPEVYPERLEGGTLALPAVVSLLEGTLYVKENTEYFANTLEMLTGNLINKLKSLESAEIYSKPNKTGVVSFNLQGKDSGSIGEILNEKYDIAVRCGFQCAPLAHKFLGTENTGAIRASFSPQNTVKEINFFVRALKEILADEI